LDHVERFGVDARDREIRKRYAGLTEGDIKDLQAIHTFMEQNVDAVVESFYEHILSFDNVREKMGGEVVIDRLKRTQKEYLLDLSRGDYGEDYFERRLHVGVVHERIDLQPQWYLGAYPVFFSEIVRRLQRRFWLGSKFSLRRYTRTITALVRLIFLDAQLAIETYVGTVAEKIAQSVTNVSTAMQELRTSSQHSAAQAEQAATEAEQALRSVDDGNAIVLQALGGMEHLREGMAQIGAEMGRLSDQTAQIKRVTDVVGNLADETNLLALNAKVEAVRAGAQGAGFTVIATRIRDLAEESRGSVDEINAIIQSIQQAADDAVKAVEHGSRTVDAEVEHVEGAGAAFQGLANSVRGLSESVRGISLNMEQQASAIADAVTTMGELDHMSSRQAGQSR
jgi:heam-based aerotactic trancducer